MEFAISEARKTVNTLGHRVYLSTLLVSTLLVVDRITAVGGSRARKFFTKKANRALEPRSGP